MGVGRGNYPPPLPGAFPYGPNTRRGRAQTIPAGASYTCQHGNNARTRTLRGCHEKFSFFLICVQQASICVIHCFFFYFCCSPPRVNYLLQVLLSLYFRKKNMFCFL